MHTETLQMPETPDTLAGVLELVHAEVGRRMTVPAEMLQVREPTTAEEYRVTAWALIKARRINEC